jgi:hypothetical protein
MEEMRMPTTAAAPQRAALTLLRFAAGAALALLCGCGVSSAPQVGGSDSVPVLSAAECLADTAQAQTADTTLVPDTAQLQSWEEEVLQFGNGFRPTGSAAELGYIDQLASDLNALGLSQVQKEAYTFPQWSATSASLSVQQGSATQTVPIAAYMPYSGSTGADGVQGQLVYLSDLSAVDLTGALLDVEQAQNPVDALGQLLDQLGAVLGDLTTGTVPLLQYLLTHSFKGEVVMYDVPRLTVPAGVFEALSMYVNNSGGTMGPLTPYSRPFVDMLFVNAINSQLKQAGAAAVIGVIDYPPEAADNSYYPFGGMSSNASIPGIYVDRDTGNTLKQTLASSGLTPVQARVTLVAPQATATSYNLSAVIPGLCPQQILIGSHVDGTNAIEDNGPAAILAIARYFMQLPQSQRLRGIRIVLTSGHFVGSAGIAAYIKAHQADLAANVLGAIEMEHLGAREWLELSPGTMALDGLDEPQLLMAKSGTLMASEAEKFAATFDRSMVMPPLLQIGEGVYWESQAGLPLLAYITGPVYLLQSGMPQVSTDFTDYGLMQRQITAFIQVIHDLEAQTVQALRPDMS